MALTYLLSLFFFFWKFYSYLLIFLFRSTKSRFWRVLMHYLLFDLLIYWISVFLLSAGSFGVNFEFTGWLQIQNLQHDIFIPAIWIPIILATNNHLLGFHFIDIHYYYYSSVICGFRCWVYLRNLSSSKKVTNIWRWLFWMRLLFVQKILSSYTEFDLIHEF